MTETVSSSDGHHQGDVEGLAVDALKARIYTETELGWIASRLAGARKSYDQEGRLANVSGQLKNLDVTAGLDYVVVAGCPGRYMNDVNLWAFGHVGMAGFNVTLASDLRLPVGAVCDALVSQLDVALNVYVAEEPASYFDTFGRAPYLTRDSRFATTLYYRQGSRGRLMRFYDKLKEIRRKGRWDLVPDSVKSRNLLRLEVHVPSASAKTAVGRPVSLGMLADRAFIPELVALWEKNVGSIERVDQAVPPMAGGGVPKTLLDRKNMLAAIGIQAMGGVELEVARIEANYKAGLILEHQKNAQIRMVYDVRLTPEQLQHASRLAEEVDAAIERVVAAELSKL